MSTLPTGAQYELSLDDQRCIVTEQGATLRAYRVADRDVVWPFDADAIPQHSQGQQLLPWPNRLADGRYRFDGQTWQVPVNEADRNTALHGMVTWVPWTLNDHTPTSVTQSVRLLTQPGWPGVLEATLTHALTSDGLVVQLSARNEGDTAVPFGYGAHPYFTLGGIPIDQWRVQVPFDRWLEVDPERLLPIQLRDGSDATPDLRGGAVLGSVSLDGAYSSPQPDADTWRVSLEAGNRRIEIWSGGNLGWLQLYTAPDRASLAVEPMSCGPDAFNDGPTATDVVRLEPGDVFNARWGVTVTDAR